MELLSIKDKDDEIVLSRSNGDNEPAHYLLQVDSFSLLTQLGIQKYESDIFEASGYKWRLLLYPNGNHIDGGQNHISLSLQIVDTKSLPQNWEVYAYLKFFVYDHLQQNYLTVQAADGKKRRFHSNKMEWGFSKLLSLNTFKDDGYLFRDSCVFGVEVFVTPKFVVKENCLSFFKPPSTNNSYTWTIDKFSSIHEDSISSEDFKVGKIKWKLVLYPKGKNGLGTHLSLFLSVHDSESLPLHWKIYVKYNLRLLDQAGTDGHVVLKGSGRWLCESGKSWGSKSFISLSNLNDNAKSYIVNDKLIVQGEIDTMGVIRSFS